MGLTSSSRKNTIVSKKRRKEKDDTRKQEDTEVISPRAISVLPAQSGDSSAGVVNQHYKTTTQHHGHLTFSSSIADTQKSLPQLPEIPEVAQPSGKHDEGRTTSTPRSYGGDVRSNHIQMQSTNESFRDRSSNRIQEAESVDLMRQIQELRYERNEMIKFNQDLTKERENLRKDLAQRDQLIDELRTRLSRVVSERLTDNNPNIADLGDQNRPMKIADKYSEVYTNEWSDAYEDLVANGKRNEREAIEILLDLIKAIYKTCFEISVQQLHELQTNILIFTGHIVRGNTVKLSGNLSSALKPFKDERKLLYKEFLATLYTEVNKVRDIKLIKKADKTEKLQKYLHSITDLCWLMCVQDPPVDVYSDVKYGTEFDESNFTSYTVRGTTVDYLVWPALHLHKHGPVLQKGVAQATASSKKQTIAKDEASVRYSNLESI